MSRIGKDERALRRGVSAERRILIFGGKFAAVCRRAATKSGAHVIRQAGQIRLRGGHGPRHGLGFAVPSELGVAALDVLERAQNWFGRRVFAVQFEMPLEGADPQHEFGDGGGAGIDFQPEELVRVNRVGARLLVSLRPPKVGIYPIDSLAQ